MSDDEIIERGGTQDDINAYAHDVGGACGAVYGGTCDYCGLTQEKAMTNKIIIELTFDEYNTILKVLRAKQEEMRDQ